MFRAVGSQFGLININLGQSSNPTVEEEVLTDVASYGRQLGRISDALAVLLARLPPAAELLIRWLNIVSCSVPCGRRVEERSHPFRLALQAP